MARAEAWPRMGTPSALARSRSSSRRSRRWWSSTPSENDSGRPDRSAIVRKRPNSASTSAKSDTTCSTPLPVAPMADEIPTSSSSAAVSVGVSSPRLVRWFMVRDVVNPSPPASMPAAASRAISAMSSGVAASRAAPRSPITWRRSAPWGTCVATSMS
jgi:hypothetical protein